MWGISDIANPVDTVGIITEFYDVLGSPATCLIDEVNDINIKCAFTFGSCNFSFTSMTTEMFLV